MSAERKHLLYQLHELYPATGQTSPGQIENYMAARAKENTLAEHTRQVLGTEIPGQVIHLIVQERGQVGDRTLKRFSSSVQRIIKEYGEEALDYLDRECIRKNGKINEQLFREKFQRGCLRAMANHHSR